MGNSFGGAVKLSGENEYKRALSTITSQLKVLGSETKLVSAQYKNNDNAAKSMTAQNEALGKELKKQNELTGIYQKAVNSLNKEQSEAKIVHSKLGKELEEEKKKLENLKSSGSATSEEIKKQEKTVSDLQSAYDKSGKQIDINENKINTWSQKLIKSKTDAQNLTNKIDDNKKSMEKASNTTGKSEKSLKDFGNEAKSSGKKVSVLGDVIKGNLISGAIMGGLKGLTSAISSCKNKISGMVSETISAGDSVDKMSQKIGTSKKGYQEWEYVLSQNGMEISSLQGGMKKLTANMDDAKAGGDSASAMFKKLGVSVTDSSGKLKSQEQMFNESVTALQNMEDGTEKAALANDLFGKSGQKLMPLLNGSAESTEALKQKANDLGMVMSDKAVKGSVDLTDSMDTLKRASSGLRNNFVGSFTPALSGIVSSASNVVGGLSNMMKEVSSTGKASESTMSQIKASCKGLVNSIGSLVKPMLKVAQQLVGSLFNAIVDNLPMIAAQGTQMLSSIVDSLLAALPEILPTIATTGITVLQTLIDGIVQALPLLIPAVVDIVTNIANLIVDNLPKIIEAGIKVIVSIAQGIAQSLPKLIPSIVKAVIQMAQTLIDNLDMIIDAALDIIMALADGLIKALPQLIKALPKIIISLVNGLLNNLPKLTECAIELMIALSLGLIEAIPELIKAVPKIIVGLVKALAEAVPKMLNKGKELVGKLGEGLKTGLSKITEIGSDLVKGLWNGIKDVTGWVMDKIKGFGQDILDGIKSFFGIHSPSRVMRDQVGAMIGHGIAIGIEKSKAKVNSAMTNIAKTIVEDGRKAFDKLSTALDKVTEKHKTSLEALKSSYKQTVTEIKNAQNSMAEKFISFSDLFKGGSQNETVSAADILKNQRETTEQYENFQKQLDLLRKKGLSESLLDQFADLGVGYANQFEELNKLSTAELKQYQVELSKQKVISNNIAKKQFVTELNDAQSEYKASIAKADKEYKKSYNKLVNNSQKYMKSVGKAIKKGLQDGSKMSTKEASKTADNIVGDLVKQIKKKMKINSPSRVMKDEVGVYLAQGVGVGFTDEMKAVKNTMSNAIPKTFGVKSDVDTAIVHSNARISAVRNNDTDKFNVVTAIKEAFNGLNVVLDDEKVGRFVIDTVGKEVYA